MTSGGIISTVAGNGIMGYSGDGGAATSASLNRPFDVAVDGEGNLYIADLDNWRIRKVTTGGVISTIAGNGTAGFSGDGGPATSASIYSPIAVAVTGDGRVYIADANVNRVRMLTPSFPLAPSNVDALVAVKFIKRNIVYTATVTWLDNSDNESAFLIRRFSNASGTCVVEAGFSATVPAGSTAYTDATASASTCGYGVASTNSSGASAFVDDKDVGTGTGPSAPTNVNAVVTSSMRGKNTVVFTGTITWENTSADVSNFLVRRYIMSGSSCIVDAAFGTVRLAAGQTSYTDSKATVTTCAYDVGALNSRGVSAFIGDSDLSIGINPF